MTETCEYHIGCKIRSDLIQLARQHIYCSSPKIPMKYHLSNLNNMLSSQFQLSTVRETSLIDTLQTLKVLVTFSINDITGCYIILIKSVNEVLIVQKHLRPNILRNMC